MSGPRLLLSSGLNANDLKHLRLLKQTPTSTVTLAQLLKPRPGVPELVAVKTSYLNASASLESSIQEADFLRFFSAPERQHPGLVGFYGTVVTESAEGQPVLLQCLEYCSGGDLLTALLAGRLEEDVARELFSQLVSTVGSAISSPQVLNALRCDLFPLSLHPLESYRPAYSLLFASHSSFRLPICTATGLRTWT